MSIAMRLELKYNSKSKLGYHRIEIITPVIDAEYVDKKLCLYHLCNTENGLVAIAAGDLMRDLEHYKKLVDYQSDVSHVLRGKL